MLKRIVIGLAGVAIVGLMGFSALAWRPAIAPIDPPAAASFPTELIAKGQALAGAGYCAVCHTRQGGEPFAGGYGLRTPFGTIFSTNLTPEPETGIGRWSLEAFTRAMNEGAPTLDSCANYALSEPDLLAFTAPRRALALAHRNRKPIRVNRPKPSESSQVFGAPAAFGR